MAMAHVEKAGASRPFSLLLRSFLIANIKWAAIHGCTLR